MFTVVPEPARDDVRSGSVELGESSSLIDEIVREGARRMLAQALAGEVEERIARFADERDEAGRRLGVRNGYHEPREVLTSAVAVAVHAPRGQRPPSKGGGPANEPERTLSRFGQVEVGG